MPSCILFGKLGIIGFILVQIALESSRKVMVEMRSLKRRVVSGVAVLGLATTGMIASTLPAHAASGTVTCTTSNIVGMWVDVDGGIDGWAARYATYDPRINTWSYDTQGKRWRVNVGCGGSSGDWDQTVKSGWTTRQGVSTISCADTGYLRSCSIG